MGLPGADHRAPPAQRPASMRQTQVVLQARTIGGVTDDPVGGAGQNGLRPPHPMRIRPVAISGSAGSAPPDGLISTDLPGTDGVDEDQLLVAERGVQLERRRWWSPSARGVRPWPGSWRDRKIPGAEGVALDPVFDAGDPRRPDRTEAVPASAVANTTAAAPEHTVEQSGPAAARPRTADCINRVDIRLAAPGGHDAGEVAPRRDRPESIRTRACSAARLSGSGASGADQVGIELQVEHATRSPAGRADG